MAFDFSKVIGTITGTANKVSSAAAQSAAASRRVAPPRTPIQTGKTGSYKPASRPASPPTTQPGTIPPSIDAFLGGDTTYQDQVRNFQLGLNNFLADATRRRGTVDSDYASSQKALNDQKVQDLGNLEADYGSRGLAGSGLYGKAVGDYNTEWNNRMGDLTTKQQQALASIQQEQGNYQSQSELQKQQALQDAIARRASKYGA